MYRGRPRPPRCTPGCLSLALKVTRQSLQTQLTAHRTRACTGTLVDPLRARKTLPRRLYLILSATAFALIGSLLADRVEALLEGLGLWNPWRPSLVASITILLVVVSAPFGLTRSSGVRRTILAVDGLALLLSGFVVIADATTFSLTQVGCLTMIEFYFVGHPTLWSRFLEGIVGTTSIITGAFVLALIAESVARLPMFERRVNP